MSSTSERRLSPRQLRCALLLSVTAALSGCSSFVYDPPPEIVLERPTEGSFVSGEPIRLTFSEPISPESFAIRLWETSLDVEGALPQDVSPVVDTCTLGQQACDQGVELEAVSDADGVIGVTLALPAQGIGKPGRTILLEVMPGLEDRDQNDRALSSFFNLQLRAPDGRFNADPVPFERGSYVFLSIINDPVPAVLTLISDVIVMPDGRLFVAGGEGDEINGAPKETTDPENLIVDPTDQGWAAHIKGFITLTEDGERLLQTDPVNLFLPTDPVFVDLNQVRLNGQIVKGEEGHDEFRGSLSFEGVAVRFGTKKPVMFGGGSQDLVGYYIPPDVVPANHPLICGDQCGAIIGSCHPPEGFPDDDVCESEAAMRDE